MKTALAAMAVGAGLVLAGCGSIVSSSSGNAPVPANSAGLDLQLSCQLGYIFSNSFYAADDSEWWVIALWQSGDNGADAVYSYGTFYGTVPQMDAEWHQDMMENYSDDSVYAGPFSTESDAQQSEPMVSAWKTSTAFTMSDSFSYDVAVQATATNDNSVMVSASSVNVDLYDASGDLLGSTSVSLGVQGIAPGVKITDADINSAAPYAASCRAASYSKVP